MVHVTPLITSTDTHSARFGLKKVSDSVSKKVGLKTFGLRNSLIQILGVVTAFYFALAFGFHNIFMTNLIQRT